jgi:cysteine synthase A
VEPVFKTGVGLAWMACLKGYKLILAIPDTVSKQHISLLKSWGAIIALTPGSKGVEGAVEKAKQLKDEISGAVILEQIAGHIVSKMSNAWDIWEYNDKIIDIFVTVDSAISHFAGLLKTKNPAIKIIGAETPEYPITENRDIVDEIVSIQNDDALKTVKELAVLEGLTVGILSGMTVAVATIISKREENFGKTILSILPDPDGCYISTILNI